jgi:hypothetical protein
MTDLPHRRPISKKVLVSPGPVARRLPVGDRLDDPAHLVHPPGLTWHEGEERLVPAGGVVGRLRAGRELVDARRQVGEEARGHGERLLLGAGHVVDRTVAGVDVGVAELLLRDGAERRPLHEGGPGDHHLGGLPHDDGVVRRR